MWGNFEGSFSIVPSSEDGLDIQPKVFIFHLCPRKFHRLLSFLGSVLETVWLPQTLAPSFTVVPLDNQHKQLRVGSGIPVWQGKSCPL